jgi:hypothetical protein
MVPPFTDKVWLEGVNDRVRAVTVRLVLPLILTPSAFANVALIEVVPGATVVATPLVPTIVAMFGWDEAHLTVLVIS